MSVESSRQNVFRNFGKRAARGILAPADLEGRIVLTRHALPEDLAAIVERVWVVRWDLEGLPPREQEVLPFPCVNVTFGDHRPGITGPMNQRFIARLTGKGRTVGIKFTPAGFRALLPTGVDARDLVDRPRPLDVRFAALDRALARSEDPDAFVALVSGFLRSEHPGLDADDEALNSIVDRCRNDSELSRVAPLAESNDRSVRALERLFRSRIGVSPKWVIRRFRVQEAALRLAGGATVDLAALAQALGYFDQSHFSHDFRAQVGRTPSQYIAFCAARRAQ